MKKNVLLAIAIIINGIIIAQPANRINLPNQLDISAIKASMAGQFPKYDTVIALVVYQDKDSIVKKDTCSLQLRAKKLYVIENYGQYDKNNLPYGVTLLEHYAIITDWKVYKAIRLHNGKSFYKGRVLDIKYLYKEK